MTKAKNRGTWEKESQTTAKSLNLQYSMETTKRQAVLQPPCQTAHTFYKHYWIHVSVSHISNYLAIVIINLYTVTIQVLPCTLDFIQQQPILISTLAKDLLYWQLTPHFSSSFWLPLYPPLSSAPLSFFLTSLSLSVGANYKLPWRPRWVSMLLWKLWNSRHSFSLTHAHTHTHDMKQYCTKNIHST